MAAVNPSDWNVVPDLVLLNVFFQLGDEDRLSMALVCKNWYRLFQSPQLWRNRRVIFSTEKPFTTATNSLGFLKTFGKNLRVLTVGFAMPNFRNAKQISKAVEFYFNKATNVPDLRLKEFTLQNANMELYWHFILSRKRIISSLCRFLRRLHELTLINLIAAKMSLTDGCRVLAKPPRPSEQCSSRTCSKLTSPPTDTSAILRLCPNSRVFRGSIPITIQLMLRL